MKLQSTPVSGGPSSSAGLVRYFDVSAGGIEVTPELVVGVCVFLIVAEAALWFLL